MPHPYEVKFPALARKYQSHENIGYILSVLEKYGDHFFNLKEIEGLADSGQWLNGTAYVNFFESCIENSGADYTEEEIKAQLFPYLAQRMNESDWYRANLSSPGRGNKEIGLWEKFQANTLGADLSKNEVLKEYAFTTVDMARTAARGSNQGDKLQVLELRHLPYLNANSFKNKPLYIRSAAGDKKGLPQWILLYYKHGEPHLYSESPILEEDKKALAEIYGPQKAILEGGTSALSMSSGIHAVAHYIQIFGGAGLSDSADYFSLLIEWVWFTESRHPSGSLNWNWQFFKERTLQWDKDTHKFALLDFNKQIGDAKDNQYMQMRSYYLGLGGALADTPSKALLIDSKKSTVTLNVTNELVNSNEISSTYKIKGHGKKAAYGFDNSSLKQRTSSGSQSAEIFANTLVLNTFRACAREKKLIINLPDQFQLNNDEQALVCYLMEMNPYVCDFQNPQKNASLVQINNNLQHIFARNRWLSLNDYLPPMLDEFWVVAAEYWVAYLQTSPDLLKDISEVNEFKRCVREMGVHGLIPLLAYLQEQESDLKPVFNILLQNMDRPPVFYAGCAAANIEQYTEVLIIHLQKKKYFPFKQFQFSFVPGVNRELITLFTELNRQEIFDKLSLMDCLVSEQSKHALKSFLAEAILQAKGDLEWVCPIHIPELEKPLDDPSLANTIRLYGELNNILIKRARQKQAEKLYENPTFAHAAHIHEDDLPPKPVAGEAAQGKTQASKALVSKFNEAANKIWEDEDKKLSLARAGGLSLQMQQQQQIKQERSRCLDNEMEKGTAYSDVLPSVLIDYTNIDHELNEYYLNLNLESPIDTSKALLSGGTTLQKFFHTWVNANPKVLAPKTIHKMTPYAAKMLLKFHRQLSGGLNVENLPRGFYTQRIASGELVLAYKSTLGYTTDHDPLTMHLTNAIPKVERVLGNYQQFDLDGDDFNFVRLLAQMQPELSADEKNDRYDQFRLVEYSLLSFENKTFYRDNALWIKNNWELFYTAYRANFLKELKDLQHHSKSVKLEQRVVLGLLLPDAPEVAKICADHPDIDYAKGLGQIYSRYGSDGLKRFANVILTMRNRLGTDFVHAFIENYLKRCDTFNPLLQEKGLSSLEQMITELAADPDESQLFETFLELHMAAVEWEDITLLWKGFSYFYNHIKEMGLEKKFTAELLRSIKPKGQNLFPCFERILKSLEKIPNQELRKEFISGIASLDLTEGDVPYAVCHDGFVLVDPTLQLEGFKEGAPTYKAPLENLFTPIWQEPLFTLRALGSKGHIKPQDYKNFKDKGLSKEMLVWALHTDWKDTTDFYAFFDAKDPVFVTQIARYFHNFFYTQNQSYRRYPLAIFESLQGHKAQLNQVLNKYPKNVAFLDAYKLVYEMADSEAHLARIFALFLAPQTPAQHPHLEQGLLLATVFGVSSTKLDVFYRSTQKLKQITHNELTFLITQLTSLNMNSLPADAALREALWTKILECIAKMDAHPLDINEIRTQLMHSLKNDEGLIFKSSISGDYRLVNNDDLQALGLEQFFEQHVDRLRHLLLNHIAISEAEKDDEPLKPLIEFFKRLQLNKTYINEIEPLLTTLEKIVAKNPDGSWTAAYLSELLRALQPEDSSAGFSISVFETLLTEASSPERSTRIYSYIPCSNCV
ncbi:hypothetical protein [Legionella sp.]|uniref:hypothetical protein n=1 Tax=Legionella sp. TaxID=459 RepID=UPI003C9E459C